MTDRRRCCCRRGCSVRWRPGWTDCVAVTCRQTSSTGRRLERGSPSSRPTTENAAHIRTDLRQSSLQNVRVSSPRLISRKSIALSITLARHAVLVSFAGYGYSFIKSTITTCNAVVSCAIYCRQRAAIFVQ